MHFLRLNVKGKEKPSNFEFLSSKSTVMLLAKG